MKKTVKPQLAVRLGVASVAACALTFALTGCAPTASTSDNSISNDSTSNTATTNSSTDVSAAKTTMHNASVGGSGGLQIGKSVPDLRFVDAQNIEYSMSDFRGVTAWVFVDVTCPCVKAYTSRLQALQKSFAPRKVRFVYVFSQPRETVAQALQFAKAQGYNGVVVRDTSQSLLRVFDAPSTTQTYVTDRNGVLRYKGRIDDSTYAPQSVKSRDLQSALNAVIDNRRVAKAETQAMACAISRL